MNSTGWAAVVIVLIVVAGGAWWYTTQAPATPAINVEVEQPATGGETGTNVPPAGSGSTGASGSVSGTVSAPMTLTVTRTANGFSPQTVTIAKGGTVTFINQAGGSMWVASNQHPSHTLYAGTSREEHCPSGAALAFDQCTTGNTYSFKFDKVGSWQYHNHAAAGELGTVIVQ